MSDVVIGAKLELDAGGATNSVKNFKQEVRLAEAEVVALTEKFGATSKEAANAAKRAAELKDKIQDAKQLVDAFNPDTKFRAFGASINTVVGGFTALTGAMTLLGVESEDVQKTLLKVQSALALSQGVAQLQEGIQAFKNFGSVIVNTLGKSGAIGLAIAGVAALGVAIFSMFDGLSEKQKALNQSLKDYEKAATSARQKVVEVQSAFKSAEAGIISKDKALKIYNETLGDTFGRTNDINVAEDRLVRNAENFIKVTGLKAQAQSLFAKSAEFTNKSLVIQDKLATMSAGIARDKVEAEFEKAKEAAAGIDALIQQVFANINSIQSQGGNLFGGVQGATGSAKTPAGKIKEQEAKEVYEFSKGIKEVQDAELERIRLATGVRLQLNTDLQASTLSLGESFREEALREQTLADMRIKTAESVGNALGALADLVGRQTAAGKVLAIAQATINMWLGVTEVLRNKTVLPEPFGTINKIASITTVVATGLNAIKNIVKTNIPGGGGGGSVPSAAVNAPLSPQAPGVTNTRLDNDQLNTIGNAAMRAFVLESDVTNNQETIRRINRQARIG